MVTGVKIWHAWKGLVQRHVYGKYKRCTSIGMGAMINFRNLNANFETKTHSKVKVKVTGTKMWACMERSCPKACVCQVLKV